MEVALKHDDLLMSTEQFIQTNSGGGSKADESGEENTQGVKQKFTQEFEGAVKQEIEQECKQDVKQEAESDKK